MTLIRHELKQAWKALLIWTLSIGAFIVICLFMYPEMKSQMNSISSIFASMGAFSSAFGLDTLDFGSLKGFYGIECGNILGIGGALFAALLGISALSREEKDGTAELLLTHPLSRAEQNELADRYIKALSIATPDAEKKIGELSGGNQQKVILARWMATQPDLLILDEPTRGIDVGAKAEIQRLMLEMCKDGVSVIFISSELEEVIRCSNRIVIMRDGKKAGELEGPFNSGTQNRILQIIAEGGDAK